MREGEREGGKEGQGKESDRGGGGRGSKQKKTCRQAGRNSERLLICTFTRAVFSLTSAFPHLTAHCCDSSLSSATGKGLLLLLE